MLFVLTNQESKKKDVQFNYHQRQRKAVMTYIGEVGTNEILAITLISVLIITAVANRFSV